MTTNEHVTTTVDRIVADAYARTGLDDLGPDSWREGLEILVNTWETTPGIQETTRDDQYKKYGEALDNRLRVIQYTKERPEVLDVPVERPLIVLGLPRTGTTVASYLLDQDSARRSLLNWEAGNSVPPPTTETLRTDPRCVTLKADLDAMAAALEEVQFPVPHWEDADGPTECTCLVNQDFKAFLWEAFMPTAAYSDWLLSTDVRSAYEYERTVLQVLQSQAPGTWSLKMPSHAVNIDTLLEVFPDARIIWAHRDPYKATASNLSMIQMAREISMGSNLDIADMTATILRQMAAHVDRPLAARRRLGDAQFYDLHYKDLVDDPIGQMKALYQWAGDTLTPETESAMAEWLGRNPQHRFGVREYSLEPYGITKADLEPIYADYLAAFDIELEGGYS